MTEDSLISTKINYKEKFKQIFHFFKNKKVQWALTIIFFLIVLIASTSIRVSNLDNLIDSTTGNYSLADLDAQYFYRIAQTAVDNNGLPEIDNMHYIGANPPSGWLKELLPKFIILVWDIVKIFNSSFSLLDAAVYSPVILYSIGLILFFLLAYFLTKSKLAALIATTLLAYSPPYLHRSVAGFADHDIMGMGAIFLCFLIYALALKNFEKNWKNTVVYGILTGFGMALVISCWGGGATFVISAIPFAFFLYYLLNSESKLKSLAFFSSLILASVVFTGVFGLGMSSMYHRFFLSYGLVVPFVLGFIIIDYFIGRVLPKIKESKYIQKKYEKLYSLLITILIGVISLPFVGKSIFVVIKEIWYRLLFPFGVGRIGLTVAENAQPYLNDWVGQTGKIIFYLFVFGAMILGFEFVKNIKSKKSKIFLALSWIYLIFAILFSRISSTSLFNGESLLSQLFYLSGILLFFGVFFWEYLKERFSADSNIILLIAIILLSIMNGRSAVRVFLMITPFVCISVGYAINRLYIYSKEAKDELLKIILIIMLIISLIAVSFSGYQYYQSTSQQAMYVGAAANYQWQNAMDWARENTGERDIFVHWWDYGYFVQTIGKRPSVTDGGHYVGYWDHLIGRYLLTTPYPETAMSYMKTNNVSYLLIDSTDIGKYPAYSSIGSDDNHDRYSGIIAMVSDIKQIQETSEGEIRVFQGTFGVEEDTLYEINGTEIFLPGPTYNLMNRPEYKSFVIGVILDVIKNNNTSGFKQPEGVFMYNGKQYRIPLKYLTYQGRVMEFESGLDAGISIIPNIIEGGVSGGIQVDNLGALIYLSPRTFNSLVGQVYILGDGFGHYPGLEIAHRESSQVVKSLKSQGMSSIGEFVYFRGIQGPLDIWKVKYNESVIVREEFLSMDGGWAEFDNLSFVK
ncbi:MAG TPA: STT3 domain-containing protein [Candidatus Nanoarchaeia archaeon]|nr:STT3 domain-containing protein [Candidatus Nanoarchaeia archaeon]